MAVGLGEGAARRLPGRSMLKLLLILLGLSLSLDTRSLFPLTRGLDLSADILRRQEECRRQVTANAALEHEIKFLRTPEGARWAAHRYMGVVKPGQQVGRVQVESPPPPRPLTQPERMRRWIAQTEEAGAASLRHAAGVVGCYFGRTAADEPAEQ